MKLLRYLLCMIFIACCTYSTIAQIKTQREYDFIDHETNSKGLRKVGIKHLYGCIDQDGNEVVPLRYKSVSISKDWEYIIVQDNNNNYGLLTSDGKYSYAYTKYKEILVDPYTFSLHKCAIFKTQNGHYGIVNSHAEEIVPPVYSYIDFVHCEKGLLGVCINGYFGIINTKGVFIAEPNYLGFINIKGELMSYEEGRIVKDGGYQSRYRYTHYGEIEKDYKNEYTKPYFQYYKKCYQNNDSIPLITSDKELIYINTLGQEIIKTGLYLNSYDFDYQGRGRFMCIKDDILTIYSRIGNVKKYKKIKRKRWKSDRPYDYSYKGVLAVDIGKGAKVKIIYFDDLGNECGSSEEAISANEMIWSNLMEQCKQKKIVHQLAEITWLNDVAISTQAEYQLQVGIKSDSKIESVEVTVNGEKDRGIKTVPAEDFAMKVDQKITLASGSNVVIVSVTNAAGTTKQEKTIIYRDLGEGLASINWLDINTTTDKKDVNVKLGIKSKTKIEDVKLTINGVTSRGIKTIASDEYDMIVENIITLGDGANRIVASVRNAEGISTSEKVITYKGELPKPIINERRIALVVGNSNYSNSVLNLRNPKNDATLVAETLEKLGFDVIVKTDVSLEEMDKLIDDFGEQSKDYDVALFFYAGHGIQSKGINYLLPINVNNLTEDNIKYKCVDLGRVLDVMEANKCRLKIIVLDACRNDPVSRSWHRGSGTRGLAIVDAPIGTIISYATSPGKTASDGDGDNSPYTEAFVTTLNTPNLEVSEFFKKVGALVKGKTNDTQVPWLSTSFTGDFFFNQQK